MPKADDGMTGSAMDYAAVLQVVETKVFARRPPRKLKHLMQGVIK